ncbi:MAG: general secretion pathway protein GspK [Proteobacteria bacterium]|nr:general secretion pathway protein GspK [Pseudomonadota bacterium]
MFRQIKNSNGSILIVVLWTLVMISYLVGDYLIHNRSKTGTAMNLTDSFIQMNAVESVLHLTTSDEWKSGIDQYMPGKWVDMNVDGVKLRFRLDNEGSRININTADDAKIRQAVVDIFNESDIEKANLLTDAILDWKDNDDLVRTQGAEKAYYESEGLNYLPADGLFKTMTELLLVKEMTGKLFWGDPGKDDTSVNTFDNTSGSTSDDKEQGSFMEKFTLFDAGFDRLSILIPLKGDSRLYFILFIKGKNSMNVVERYTEFLEG